MFAVLAAAGPYAIVLAPAWIYVANLVAARRLGNAWLPHLLILPIQPAFLAWLIWREPGSLVIGFVLFLSVCYLAAIAWALLGRARTPGYRDDLDVLLLRRPDAPPLPPRARWQGAGLLMAGTLALSAIALAGVGARTCGWLDRIAGASGCAAVLRLEGSANGMALAPDGSALAVVAGYEGETRRWDLGTGRRLPLLQLPDGAGERAYMKAIAWSMDGTLLATGGDGLYVWDAATGTLLRTLALSSTNAVLFLPDGTLLAGVDDAVEIWPSAQGPRAERLPTPFEVYALDASPDGTMLAAGGYDGGALLWDLPSRQRLRELPAAIVYDLAFSPDGRLLATAEVNAGPAVWRVGDGTMVWRGADPPSASQEAGERDSTWSVAFSPDGSLLASGTYDGLLAIWRAADGTPLATRSRDEWIRQLAWTPWDGGRLAVGLSDERVELWRVPRGGEW